MPQGTLGRPPVTERVWRGRWATIAAPSPAAQAPAGKALMVMTQQTFSI